MSTTLSTLHQRLSESIGDWIEEAVTTAIAASASIVSTNLNKWDNARDDIFNNKFWAYITDKANAGVERLIYDYATSTGTCSVRGGNLTTDGSNLATVRFGRYSYDSKKKAILEAIRDLNIIGLCQRKIDDRSLVSGNHLYDGSFEDWTSSSALRFYTALSGTLARTATAGYIRGQRGSYSAKYTAGATNDYFSISSNTYPHLLDLMGKTIDFKCWAYPQTANDAYLVIYTIKADGTAQTLTSTTTCPAGKWTLLELEDQAINDDIVQIDFRFKVATNGQYVYFDNSRVIGGDIYDYILPNSLQNGEVRQVHIQTSSGADDPCDDLMAATWQEVFHWHIKDDGTYKYLHLPYVYGDNYTLRLIGYGNLEVLSAFTDTISLDDPLTDTLIAYAAYKLFEREEGLPAGNDITRYATRAAKAYRNYMMLKLNSEGKISTNQIVPPP